jgi:transposase
MRKLKLCFRIKTSRSSVAGRPQLKRWEASTGLLEDGRLCVPDYGTEGELRPVTVGRKDWTCGHRRRPPQRCRSYTLIRTAKLNGIDPQTWLVDVPLPE